MTSELNVNPPELLTREAAAQYIGCKAQTLAIWASTHRYDLPFIRVGRLVRYRKSDLDEFLRRRTVGAADTAST
jgi:excisionase family DNA binding protein